MIDDVILTDITEMPNAAITNLEIISIPTEKENRAECGTPTTQ